MTVFMGQESESHIIMILCLMVYYRTADKLLAWATVISRFNWGRIRSHFLVVVVRPQVLAGCWQDISVPCHASLCIGQLTTWQLSSFRNNDKE